MTYVLSGQESSTDCQCMLQAHRYDFGRAVYDNAMCMGAKVLDQIMADQIHNLLRADRGYSSTSHGSPHSSTAGSRC